MEKQGTRTGEGIPVGTSREEEKLEELGINAESTVAEAKEAGRQAREGRSAAEDPGGDRILQRTQDGYEETSVDDIPLSEQAGEARADKPHGGRVEPEEE